jgi:hypothetical protein
VKRLIVLLVVVAAVVAAAAFTVDNNAATVNGSSITNDTVNSQLAAIATSDGYQCYLYVDATLNSQPAVTPIYGVGGSSTYNTGAANAWLTQLVEAQLISGLVADRGLTITAADLSAGRATLLEQIDGVLGQGAQQEVTCGSSEPTSAQAVLDSLPGWFVDTQVQHQANQDALLAHEAGYSLSSADIQRYFDDHPGDFEKLCVSEVDVTTQAAANQVISAVGSGSTFAAAAAAAATTVDSGCVTPSDSNYASIAQAVTGLGAGKLTGVLTVQAASSTTQGQYIVFQLDSRTAATFAESGGAVRDAMLSAGSTKADDALVAAVHAAQVTVDPRYGSWHPTTVLITLPSQPPASVVLNPVANDPAASG